MPECPRTRAWAGAEQQTRSKPPAQLCCFSSVIISVPHVGERDIAMTSSREPCFRRAGRTDLSAVEVFLMANERPTDGVADHLEHFWLAISGDQIIGSAGLETYGEVGLLRSVAVLPERRNQGIAKALVERIKDDARCEDVKVLYLLTGSARRFFEGLGFHLMTKTDAPRALLASAEFQGICPASDVLMKLALRAPDTALESARKDPRDAD